MFAKRITLFAATLIIAGTLFHPSAYGATATDS